MKYYFAANYNIRYIGYVYVIEKMRRPLNDRATDFLKFPALAVHLQRRFVRFFARQSCVGRYTTPVNGHGGKTMDRRGPETSRRKPDRYERVRLPWRFARTATAGAVGINNIACAGLEDKDDDVILENSPTIRT